MSKTATKQLSQFLIKLTNITHSERWRHLIQWDKDGSAFSIMDTATFSQEVLPTVFKHNNYTSFQRQMHLYGFARSSSNRGRVKPGGANVERYIHPFFKLNQPELTYNIVRRSTSGNAASSQQAAASSSDQQESRERTEQLERRIESLETQTHDMKSLVEEQLKMSQQLSASLTKQEEMMVRIAAMSNSQALNSLTFEQTVPLGSFTAEQLATELGEPVRLTSAAAGSSHKHKRARHHSSGQSTPRDSGVETGSDEGGSGYRSGAGSGSGSGSESDRKRTSSPEEGSSEGNSI